jgi:MFS family permease
MLATLPAIASLMLSTFLILMAQGVASLLLPLRAREAGWSSSEIGWMGSVYAVGFTLACLVVAKLVRRAGHIRVFAVLATGLAMALLLHALFVDPLAWTVIRGMGGFCLAGTYMVVESWLNERAENANRGAIFSIYMITSMVGLMAGQYAMPLGPQTGDSLYIISALIFLAGIVPVSLTTAQSPKPVAEARLDLIELYRTSPAALVGTFLCGVIAGNWNFLAAVYGAAIGLSTLSVATMLASAMVGGALFQFPLGRISDFVDRRIVMVGTGLFGIALSLLFIFVDLDAEWQVFGAMILFGAVLYPIYSLAVAHANDFARPEDFVKISSGLLIVYGVGSMIGPVLGGFAMDETGAAGFFWVMLVNYTLFAAYAFWRTLKREAVAPDKRPDFRARGINKTPTPETYALEGRTDER